MSPPINTRMSRNDWLVLVLLSLIWGGSFALVKTALSGFPPITVVTIRVSVAALALAVILAAMRQALPQGRALWRAFFGMGLWNNVFPWILFAYAQTVISSGLAAIINAATPLVTAVVAHALTTDEKLSVGKVAGVVIGIVGVMLIVGPSVAAAPAAGETALFGRWSAAAVGEVACLIATVSYALSAVYGRRFRAMNVKPAAAAFGQMAMASLVLIPLSLIIDQPWTLARPGFAPVAAALVIGVVCTGFAYILFYRLLATAGATNLMLVTFLIPVWALMVGAFAFGETISSAHAAGIAVIGLGLAVIDGRVFAVFGRRTPSIGGRGRRVSTKR